MIKFYILSLKNFIGKLLTKIISSYLFGARIKPVMGLSKEINMLFSRILYLKMKKIFSGIVRSLIKFFDIIKNKYLNIYVYKKVFGNFFFLGIFLKTVSFLICQKYFYRY